MIQYIFPFDKIDKGSSIVVWGSGKVGQDYWKQIMTTRYCENIDIVDKCATEEDWIVHSAEYLNISADYIVIAVSDPIAVERIREELIHRGVELDKIVSDIRTAEDAFCELKTEDIKSQNIWKRLIKEYKNNSFGRFEYLSLLINDLHNYENKDEIRSLIKRVISDFIPEEQVILLRIFMQAECFDDEMMRQYMSCLTELKNKELVVFLLYEIVWAEIAHEEYRYDNYYNDRRKIIKENTEALLKNKYYSLQKRQFVAGQRIRKVCILRQNLPDYSRSSASQLAIDWANEFSKMGCEVLILSAGYLDGLNIVSFIRLHGLQESFEENSQYIVKNVRIEKAKGENISEKMCYMLNRINEFCPDLIIDTCADYEMLSSIIYQFFPLIQIPFRGVNSCTYHHRCIVNSKELFEIDWDRFHSVKKENVIFLRRTRAFQEDLNRIESVERGVERKKYSISEDSFLLASVSNRLIKELNCEFIDCIACILNKYENMIWILVGVDSFPYIQEQYEKLIQSGRIILWGYEDEILSFYKRLDIGMFIYPETTGNAGSAGYALWSQAAVLTMRCNGDIASTIGIDNMVENDILKFRSKIEELYNNPALLHKQWKREMEYFNGHIGTVENYIKTMLDIGNEIVKEKFMRY